jgi:rod shape determining protein RodA
MLIDRRLVAHFDWGLLIATLLIPCLGVIVLYSAGFDPDSRTRLFSWLPEYLNSTVVIKQVVFLGAGLIVMLVAMSLPPSFLARLSVAMYIFCVMLLVAVLLAGVVVNGSRRWLSFGGFNLQPAEPMKFALILFLARYLSRKPPDRSGYGLVQLIAPVLIMLLPMALIMKQPDLGTAMVVGGIGTIMILFMGVRPKPILILLVSLAVLIVPFWKVAWNKLHDYQQKRIITLINPETDPLGSGYHIIQSKIAVGSGGLLGKGYMKGTQSQLEFLPEHTTDFIFSVLSEEWGFIGSALVIVAYMILIYRLLRVVARGKDLFQSLVVVGVCAQIFLHSTINIGMVVGLFPVVGIPLPLFSYGGSSVISTMFGIGIVMGVSIRRFVFSSGR